MNIADYGYDGFYQRRLTPTYPPPMTRADIGSVLPKGSLAAKHIGNYLRFTTDIEFSSTDNDTAAWTQGTINFADGVVTETIAAGNTGDISATTYVYYDAGIKGALQTTTDPSVAIDDLKTLIAIVQEGAAGKSCQIVPTTAAGLVVTDITANNIQGNQLDVLAANTGTLTVDESLTMNAAGHIKGGQTDYDTGTGYWLGYTGAAYKFSIGNDAGDKLTWDGSSLNITGNLTADSGTIAGWAINSDNLRKDVGDYRTEMLSDASGGIIRVRSIATAADQVGLTSQWGSNTVAIYAGSTHGNKNTAPFRVTKDGDLTATSATIQSSGSGARTEISSDALKIYSASGLVANLDGNSLDFYGDDANIYFNSGKTAYISDSGVAGGYVTFYGGGKLEIGGNSEYIRWGQVGYEDGVKFDTKLYATETITAESTLAMANGQRITSSGGSAIEFGNGTRGNENDDITIDITSDGEFELYGDNTLLLTAGSGQFQFKVDAQVRDGERLYLYSDGNDKNAQLYHNDTDFVIDSNNGDIVIGIAGNNMKPDTDDQYDLGGSLARWDDIWATNTTIQSSDRTLKTSIKDSDLGLDFVNQLRPVSYRWKRKKRYHYGLVAQDVEEILDGKDFAGLIKDEETGRYGLRYGEFVAPLVKAVQELSEKVKNLEDQLMQK